MSLESAVGDFVIGRAGAKNYEGIVLEITRAAGPDIKQECRVFIPSLSGKQTKFEITSDEFGFVRRDPIESVQILTQSGFRKENGVWALPEAEPNSMPVNLARPADKDMIPGLKPFTFSRSPSPSA